MTLSVVRDYLYLFGGSGHTTRCFNDVYVYDPLERAPRGAQRIRRPRAHTGVGRGGGLLHCPEKVVQPFSQIFFVVLGFS